jgi:putative transposase
VIAPDTIVIDGGKVFVSETFTRACERLGVTVQRARPATPTDKAIVEATFASVNTLFCQHVASYTGSNVTLRGTDAAGAWTIPELQDLLDEWILFRFSARLKINLYCDLLFHVTDMSATRSRCGVPA